MTVGIVGGGILGLSLAHYLSRSGIKAAVFEARDRAGGLLDPVEVDGVHIDRYYHCVLPGDVDLLSLVDEIGLRTRVRFAETRQGLYRHGSVYPLATARDFLLFPPLTVVERARLGLTVLSALVESDWRRLDGIGVEDWLVRLGGRGTFEKLWRPLLRAKFDGNFRDTPATYIWSRLRRTSSTRSSAGQRERMGYFAGSCKVLVDRLVERIESAGSSVKLGAQVRRLLLADDGRVVGVLAGDEHVPLDAVVVTAPLPVLSRIVPDSQRQRLGLTIDGEYLGVVCGLLLLDRPLTPFYTLNIADDDIPFTGLVETTNLIAPEHAGGYHLVYLPKYVTPDSSYLRHSDEELREQYLVCLKRMFPAFSETWVKRLFVFREPFVEPLHLIGRPRPVVPITTELPGLYVVNNGQIYPELTNCQASVQHAIRALPIVLGHMAMAPDDAEVASADRR